MPKSSTEAVERFESELRRFIQAGEWEVTRPLPTTRHFAREHEVSNATVQRVLRRFAETGLLWRSDTGRYFLAGARDLVENPKPVVCLLRHLESWTASYRLILESFSAECGRARRSLLLPHFDALVRHPDLAEPPAFGTLAQQKSALAGFFKTQESQSQAVLLDHLWQDEALRERKAELRHGVLLWRTTALPFLSTVSVDFALGAALGLGHLLARGFTRVVIAVPFRGDAVTDEMLRALLETSKTMGLAMAPGDVRLASTPGERAGLVAELREAPGRTGVFSLEDNVSVMLQRGLAQAGIDCPEKIGLLSGMGGIAQGAGISTLQIPFGGMGSEAARLVEQRGSRPRQIVLPPGLVTGKTT